MVLKVQIVIQIRMNLPLAMLGRRASPPWIASMRTALGARLQSKYVITSQILMQERGFSDRTEMDYIIQNTLSTTYTYLMNEHSFLISHSIGRT